MARTPPQGTAPTVETTGEQPPEGALPPPPASPRRISHFVLLERLGAGSMGVVWAAFDEQLERKVAIKLVRPHTAGPDGDAQRRLLREAQALARLSHPNVTAVHEAGVLPEGEVFLAMEYVKGVSLRQWRHEAPRSWHEVLAAYVAAAEGLAAAHRAGIVHRDFKPDNVLVGQDGRVRVADFGLALAGEVKGGPAGPAGTPGYIAPEQFSGKTIDARSDQFSFCASLYEALYGERPFADFAFAREGGDPAAAERRPRPADPHARWLWEALEHGLAVAPEARFPTMEALISALTRDHGRARRRALVAAGIALAIASTSLATLRLSALRSPCDASPAELSGAWDAAAKQGASAALLGTGLPYARDVWAAVESRLDRYAEQWLGARQAACEDTHVRRTQSPELLDRRMECLAARKRSLAAVVEVLAASPARATQASDALLQELGDLGVCADPGVLRLGLPPPREARAVARLEELRGHLTRGEALLAAGDLPAAGEATGAAAEIDVGLGYPPANAEVLRLQGKLALASGRLAEGKDRLHAALAIATEARHDELVADAWLALARAGASHRPLSESRDWVRQADAWLRRLGHGDDRRRLDLTRALGDIQVADGQPREAAATFTRALEDAAARRVDKVWLVPLHRGRAIALARAGEAGQALDDYRRALALSLGVWGPGHPDVGITRRALGLLQIERLGQVAEGRREIEQAAAILAAAQGDDSPQVAECEQALSQADMFSGDYRGALRHAERAAELFERRLGPHHRRTGEALLGIGVLLFMVKDYAGSLAAYERARGILEATLGPEHVDVGMLLSNLGETLLAQGDGEAAIQHFERALSILRRGLGPAHANLAFPLKGLGLAQLAGRHHGLARQALEESLAVRERSGGGDPQELAETRWALARALAGLGEEPDRRRQLAAAALQGYRALGPEWSGRAGEIARWLGAP